MASYFRQARNVELSTIDFLKAKIDATWSGITTTKTWTQATEKNLPVVCIRLAETTIDRFEIGNTKLDNDYLIVIDIFAQSDGQRIDLADFITNELKETWDYNSYSHASGDKSSIVATASGKKISVTNFITNSKLEFGESVERKDRFRHNISMTVKKH